MAQVSGVGPYFSLKLESTIRAREIKIRLEIQPYLNRPYSFTSGLRAKGWVRTAFEWRGGFPVLARLGPPGMSALRPLSRLFRTTNARCEYFAF
jgi:hypothetical protein